MSCRKESNPDCWLHTNPDEEFELHTCPFAEGMGNYDDTSSCDCCPSCEGECAFDL